VLIVNCYAKEQEKEKKEKREMTGELTLVPVTCVEEEEEEEEEKRRNVGKEGLMAGMNELN